MNPEQFLVEKFGKYYSKTFVSMPPSIARREFGFGVFGRKILSRHLAFSSLEEFNFFLRKEVPLFVSYSTAYYDLPAAKPMNAKHFLGADIVYEFDSTDFKTPCSLEHTTWVCGKCNSSGTGKPSLCSNCGEKVEVKGWVCEKCLEEVKIQTIELIDFLQNDFGFSEGISVNYSGHRGFHVHIRSDLVYSLDHNARLEMLDYLTANTLSLQSLGFYFEEKIPFCPTPSNSFGWSRRILDSLISFFKEADEDSFAGIAGLRKKEASGILSNRIVVLSDLTQGKLFPIGSVAKTKKFWKNVLGYIVEKNALKIDRQTSIDMSKIIRVPDTLHGDTGFLAKRVEISKLSEFDALSKAIVFSSLPITLYVKKAPKFYLNGQYFGPFTQERVTLPEYAAIYLVGKKVASVEDLK